MVELTISTLVVVDWGVAVSLVNLSVTIADVSWSVLGLVWLVVTRVTIGRLGVAVAWLMTIRRLVGCVGSVWCMSI